MKKTVIFSAIAAVAAVAGTAQAQELGRVLSSTPVVQQVAIPQQVCGNETVYSGNRTSGAGAVMGAMDLGSAEQQFGERQVEQRGDLLARPVGTDRTCRCGRFALADEGVLHGIRSFGIRSCRGL